MSSSSDESEFNRQPLPLLHKASQFHSHNDKKSFNVNKTGTGEPSIMTESAAFPKKRTDSQPHIHKTLSSGNPLPILAPTATHVNKTGTGEPSIMTGSAFQKKRIESEPHIHPTLLSGNPLPILATSATLSQANLTNPTRGRHYLQVKPPFL